MQSHIPLREDGEVFPICVTTRTKESILLDSRDPSPCEDAFRRVATALDQVVEDCDGVYIDSPEDVWAALVGLDGTLEYAPEEVKQHFTLAARRTSCSTRAIDGYLVVYVTKKYVDAEDAFEAWLMRTDVRLRV